MVTSAIQSQRNRLYRTGIRLTIVLLASFLLMSAWIKSHMSYLYTYELIQRDATAGKSDKVDSSLAYKSPNALEIDQLRFNIRIHNEKQTILNEDVFGHLKNDSLVIITQVHNRLMYLKRFIMSLAQAKGIEHALLIFSHDYYDEDINSLIQSIEFCKVMQIFYPYSIQTHPNVFPGDSPNDCPPNINMDEAIQLNCSNVLHPDKSGHYREANMTQMKHHWWWKANYLFSELRVTKYFTGLVMFSEEDHYVAPDFIHMIHLMKKEKQEHCPHCEILSLGSHMEAVDFRSNSGKAEITQWITSNSNIGMIFDRKVWGKFKLCANMFCTYNDYNWDWTLLAISIKCVSPKITVMILKAPRVYHIGECGFHHRSRCNVNILNRVRKMLAESSEYLYPQNLQLIQGSSGPFNRWIQENGNWGDVRDHILCLKMLENRCLQYCDISHLGTANEEPKNITNI